jgi:hypothetical protein
MGTVTIVGFLVVLDMLLSSFKDGEFWGDWIFSEVFVIPVFVACYLVAPYVVPRLPLK